MAFIFMAIKCQDGCHPLIYYEWWSKAQCQRLNYVTYLLYNIAEYFFNLYGTEKY